MSQHNGYFENVLGVEKPTDMEIVLFLLRQLDQGSFGFEGAQGPNNGGDPIFKIAEETFKSLTNPFAKKLLMDKMTENRMKIERR